MANSVGNSLALMKASRAFGDDAARKALLSVFDLLGGHARRGPQHRTLLASGGQVFRRHVDQPVQPPEIL